MRQNIMLCNHLSLKRLDKWRKPFYLQPKINGIRARWHEGKLWSSEGNEITGVPHINAALRDIHEHLDGELYIHGEQLGIINGIASTKIGLHPDYKRIEYHVFDIVSDEKQADRFTQLYYGELYYFFKQEGPCKSVPFFTCISTEQVMDIFNDIIALGYEGIVLRDPDGYYVPCTIEHPSRRGPGIMKYKPRETAVACIDQCIEEYDIHGNPKAALGSFSCRLRDISSGSFGVGTGFTRTQRERFWNNRSLLIGQQCTIKYQELTVPGNVPLFPVFDKILVQEA